jgi:hypothetical protein
MTPAKKYTRNMVLVFSSYTLILFGVNSYMAANDLPQWQKVILALLPMVPIVLFMRAVLVFARSWDELQQRKAFEALLVSFFIVGFGTFAYGFLEGVGFPKLDTIWIMPAMIGIFGVSQAFVARRYE